MSRKSAAVTPTAPEAVAFTQFPDQPVPRGAGRTAKWSEVLSALPLKVNVAGNVTDASDEQPAKKFCIWAAFEVSNRDRSREVSLELARNMFAKFVTLEVLKRAGNVREVTERPRNALYIAVTFDVSNASGSSRDASDEQSMKRHPILATLEVSKAAGRSRDSSDVQLANIYPMFHTLEVSKVVGKLNETRFEQPLNIYAMLVTCEVSNVERSRELSDVQPLNR